MHDLTPADLRLSVEANLAEGLDWLEKEYALRRHAPGLAEALRAFLGTPGRRLRPLLFLLAYHAYARRPDPGIGKAAAALELFHSFALIHDDLLDHSAVRRGAPAMHVLLGRQAPRSRSKPGRSREGLAMLAGDVLFAAAVEAFATATRDAARAREALQMLMRAAVSTGTGAFLEVSTRERPLKQISRRTVLRICELKTALYTFVCPLTTGAWLAGAAPAECQRLDACGRLLGRAYQLRDDLADLRACLTPGGRAEAPTFDETRTTLPVWYAFKAASRREQAWMQRLYDRSSPTSADLANLRRLLERTQALARTDRLIQRLLRQADHTAGQLALPAAARERLTHCIHEFFVPAGAPEAARPC